MNVRRRCVDGSHGSGTSVVDSDGAVQFHRILLARVHDVNDLVCIQCALQLAAWVRRRFEPLVNVGSIEFIELSRWSYCSDVSGSATRSIGNRTVRLFYPR